MEFKGLTLDKFQEDAIAAIDRGHSVVVSASTGTGKTLIAEYIISKHMPDDVVIYTAPIKALSNQKYRDFCEDYGEENVGLLTGDVSINNTAPLLVMTTEIYRNMLLTNDPLVDKIKYVIFDEVHYINDIQRGTVWEESIIFSPEHIRFLALSATIPNYNEFAQWIQSIKKHAVETVFYGNRPVPLDHKIYDTKLGLTTIEKLQADLLLDESNYEMLEMHRKKKKKKKGRNIPNMKPPHHLDVIKDVNVPALFFCFSRKKTQEFAVECARKKDYLSSEESQVVTAYVRSQMTPEIASMDNTRMLRSVLPRGVGFHHSGMLPQLKTIVEHLFGKGLIKMLYTTETFSVGINMPAKTVIFNGLDKYDGVSLRMLNAKEYFQIAGRAGRRGIDTKGDVIAMVSRKYTNLPRLQKISTVDDEPIISQFTLSMNTVLNLVANYDDETQEEILKSSFDYYVKTKNKKKVHIMASYNNRIKTLKKLKYIVDASTLQGDDDSSYVEHRSQYVLTDKGRFASKLYANEILLTELFHLPQLDTIYDLDLLTLLAAIVYEPRRLDYFMIKGSEKIYRRILKVMYNTRLEREVNRINLKRMINFVKAWATGAKFTQLMTYSNLAEGDIIRFFRRLIDTLSQLQHATENRELRDRLEKLIEMIDRDLVRAEL